MKRLLALFSTICAFACPPAVAAVHCDSYANCRRALGDHFGPGAVALLDRCVGAHERTAISACDRLIVDRGAQLGGDARAQLYLYRSIGHQYFADLDRALADLDRAIATEPADARFYLLRARLRRTRGDRRAALADFDRAIALEPRPRSYLQRGELYLVLKDRRQAAADWRAALATAERQGETRSRHRALQQLLAIGERPQPGDRALDALGRCLLWISSTNKRHYDGPLAACDQTVRLAPRSAEAHTVRGTALVKARHFEDAIAALDEAIRLSPTFAEAYYQRARARYSLGDYPGAIQDSTRTLTLAPEYLEAYGRRAAAHLRLGNRQHAAADCRRVAVLLFERAELVRFNGTLALLREIAPESDADGEIKVAAP